MRLRNFFFQNAVHLIELNYEVRDAWHFLCLSRYKGVYVLNNKYIQKTCITWTKNVMLMNERETERLTLSSFI